MLFIITLFIFSISVAFALIARKIWQLRSGRVEAGAHEKADWTHISIESISRRLAELVKFAIHHSALFVLKAWIIVANWIKRTDHKIKDRLTHFLHKNAHYPAGGKPSRFLKNIRAHKDSVTEAIEKERVSEVAESEEK